jgi:DNA/RNA endonuclease G (NUC1)
MKKNKIEKIIIFILMNIFIMSNALSQQIVTKSKLIIQHPDMTLYLQKDTNTMVSVHNLTYDNYLKIGTIIRKDLGDPWFDDTYKGKFKEKYYKKNNFDLGHLTPFKETSYSKEVATNSFSSYNQSPQDEDFNRISWKGIEKKILDSIGKYKTNSYIITGVIYNNDKPNYLTNSRIKIPIYYYKILFVSDKRYYWLGDNTPGSVNPVKETTLEELNKLFKDNKMDLKITSNIK